MNLDPLKTELAKSDYDALIAAGDHSGLAARLNAKTVSLLRPVSSASLLAWSAQNNRFRKIEAMLGALVGSGVLEQSDADAITTLATVVVPWSQTIGIVEIGVGHIINALREMESA